tara:strand:- start:3779 stop:4198 length:420 start_codon:yes stop_codon:yes gene_type:complete
MDTQFTILLSRQTSKWCESTNKEMFDDIFSLLYHWILNQHELIILNDKITFQHYFYAFLCSISNGKKVSYDEYFVMKYSEDSINLFIQMKDITKSYGSFFLHEKGRTADDLLQFIFENTTLLEEEDPSNILEDNLNEYD